VLVTGKAEPVRVLAVVGKGQLRWVRVAAQPVRSTNGTLTGSISTFTDITERVTAQGALRESAARLELALSTARMGVWEFEPSTDVGFWSPNLNSLFMLAGRERGFSGFLAHVHSEDRPTMIAHATRIVQGRVGDSFEQEFRIVGEDQVTRWARLRGSLSGIMTRRVVIGTIVDITEQHQLEEELRRASRLESIGRLAGGVAHDFNNLLAAMLGSLEFVQEQCPDSAKEDLLTISHSALRARDLTRQLLAFARKQPLEWKTVDLAALICHVELMLRRLVGPSIEITITDSGPVLVQADPSLLEQVLVNLVVNARDAMPNGGRLDIEVKREANLLATSGNAPAIAVLEVSDSGVGMDEDTRKRVFEPFFTTKVQGTGLGLASSHGIILQHQGDITVESRPGHGTRFRVTLPALSAAQTATAVVTKRASIRLGTGLVLIVDDEDIVRGMTARMVKSLGYDVLTARNGAEAMECAERQQGAIQLLLCDIAMPGEDGPTVAARLLAQHTDLKVLFMSGYSSDKQEESLSGALFLQKPFSRAELAERLAELQGSGASCGIR
jgi:signal transduction histidine kinase/CheY-like chemotaxis protein